MWARIPEQLEHHRRNCNGGTGCICAGWHQLHCHSSVQLLGMRTPERGQPVHTDKCMCSLCDCFLPRSSGFCPTPMAGCPSHGHPATPAIQLVHPFALLERTLWYTWHVLQVSRTSTPRGQRLAGQAAMASGQQTKQQVRHYVQLPGSITGATGVLCTGAAAQGAAISLC